jgi:hypothetical protein
LSLYQQWKTTVKVNVSIQIIILWFYRTQINDIKKPKERKEKIAANNNLKLQCLSKIIKKTNTRHSSYRTVDDYNTMKISHMYVQCLIDGLISAWTPDINGFT